MVWLRKSPHLLATWLFDSAQNVVLKDAAGKFLRSGFCESCGAECCYSSEVSLGFSTTAFHTPGVIRRKP